MQNKAFFLKKFNEKIKFNEIICLHFLHEKYQLKSVNIYHLLYGYGCFTAN